MPGDSARNNAAARLPNLPMYFRSQNTRTTVRTPKIATLQRTLNVLSPNTFENASDR